MPDVGGSGKSLDPYYENLGGLAKTIDKIGRETGHVVAKRPRFEKLSVLEKRRLKKEYIDDREKFINFVLNNRDVYAFMVEVFGKDALPTFAVGTVPEYKSVHIDPDFVDAVDNATWCMNSLKNAVEKKTGMPMVLLGKTDGGSFGAVASEKGVASVFRTDIPSRQAVPTDTTPVGHDSEGIGDNGGEYVTRDEKDEDILIFARTRVIHPADIKTPPATVTFDAYRRLSGPDFLPGESIFSPANTHPLSPKRSLKFVGSFNLEERDVGSYDELAVAKEDLDYFDGHYNLDIDKGGLVFGKKTKKQIEDAVLKRREEMAVMRDNIKWRYKTYYRPSLEEDETGSLRSAIKRFIDEKSEKTKTSKTGVP